jgi:DNA (cytosine-5)-methyltransferase 1
VDDSRNPLILSQLAWVDFLKPRFCVFENVPCFLFSKLQHTEKGPVEQGYIKFLIQAMRKLGSVY